MSDFEMFLRFLVRTGGTITFTEDDDGDAGHLILQILGNDGNWKRAGIYIATTDLHDVRPVLSGQIPAMMATLAKGGDR